MRLVRVREIGCIILGEKRIGSRCMACDLREEGTNIVCIHCFLAFKESLSTEGLDCFAILTHGSFSGTNVTDVPFGSFWPSLLHHLAKS